MSSIKKNSGLPGFEIDPVTGKYFTVPVNFAAVFSESETKRPNQKWSNPRKCNETHSTQPVKFRKIETGVRKELFKLPQKHTEKCIDNSSKDAKSKPSGVRKCLIKSLPSKTSSRRLMTKKSDPNESLHMVPIKEEFEQLEETTKNQEYSFESPLIPHIKSQADDVDSPDSLKSNANFLRLEMLCRSPIIRKNDSPVSTVCNMFESNMLLDSVKKKANNNQQKNQQEVFLQLRQSIRVSQELHRETSSKIKEILEMQSKQEENVSRILFLIEKLDNDNKSFAKSDNEEEKENSSIKRRSLRLQNKSPVKNKNQPAGSPVILKAGDLRKSTLTKSLVSKCQKYQIESPRIQKAIDMYNTTRSVCSALLTPKISRSDFCAASPKSSNWRSNLSLKVQEQCLMLQDTPVHK